MGADRKEKKAADMKNTISKLKDKIKAMGLDYMKFGRYGKDGKVTHKVSGDSLVKVSGKDAEEPAPADKTPKNDPAVDNPEVDVKPKIDPFDAQKDLEDMVTDGMIDVEDDGEGGLEMSKEYEPSQDYEAERDVKSIKQYLKINVKVRGQKNESLMPKKRKVDIAPDHDAVE